MNIKYLFLSFFSCSFYLWSEKALSEHPIIKKYCLECHNDDKQKGDLNLVELNIEVDSQNHEQWHDIYDQIKSYEMPPEDEIEMNDKHRKELINFVEHKIDQFEIKLQSHLKDESMARRLTLIEYENTLKDLFEIDHLGTNAPLEGIMADAYDHGFNHLSKNLIMSPYHINSYINSARKVIDNIILKGKKPKKITREFRPKDFQGDSYPGHKTKKYINIIAPEKKFRLRSFQHFPNSGYYLIKLKAYGVNKNYPYSEEDVGISKVDPIKLGLHIGSEKQIITLPDDHCEEDIIIKTWVTENSPLSFSYQTDGLRMQNNGNFKFNRNIVPESKDPSHIKLSQKNNKIKVTAHPLSCS